MRALEADPRQRRLRAAHPPAGGAARARRPQSCSALAGRYAADHGGGDPRQPRAMNSTAAVRAGAGGTRRRPARPCSTSRCCCAA
ncbi:MAG: hypothetical protein MZW92_51115 [Comamonadaceae bacterium]|nr:hypothetical protein [Comamonadaceae bacterium]